MVRTFAADKRTPGAGTRDAAGEFPHEIFRELAALGLLGMLIPESLGGAGMDTLSYVLAVEELATTAPA
jgi:butyryl-CoA dehydrogenase